MTTSYAPNVTSYYLANQTVLAKHDATETQKYRYPFIQPAPFSCCGLIGIHSVLSISFDGFADKAAFVHALWSNYKTPGTLMYVLERRNLECPFHRLMLELGAKRLGDEFPNLNYSDHMLSVWIVVVKDITKPGLTRFLDEYGRVRAKDPVEVEAAKKAAAVKPEELKV